jgi:hypothetical protein
MKYYKYTFKWNGPARFDTLLFGRWMPTFRRNFQLLSSCQNSFFSPSLNRRVRNEICNRVNPRITRRVLCLLYKWHLTRTLPLSLPCTCTVSLLFQCFHLFPSILLCHIFKKLNIVIFSLLSELFQSVLLAAIPELSQRILSVYMRC